MKRQHYNQRVQSELNGICLGISGVTYDPSTGHPNEKARIIYLGKALVVYNSSCNAGFVLARNREGRLVSKVFLGGKDGE